MNIVGIATHSDWAFKFLRTKTKVRKLGNVISRRSRSHRRPRATAMASAAAAKPHPSFEFSADSPPARLRLSPDQYNYCSQALKFFKDKLQMPHQINQEFALLQVFACTSSLFSQNRLLKLVMDARARGSQHLRWREVALWLWTLSMSPKIATPTSYHVCLSESRSLSLSTLHLY